MKLLSQQLCLTENQHGFIPERSFLTNLLETFENWPLAIDDVSLLFAEDKNMDRNKRY